MVAAPDMYMNGVIFSAENISLALGGRPILRDLSFTVQDAVRPGHTTGQVIGLLGPSGIGKTQLFRILAGLQVPDTGRVLVGPEQVPVERGMVGVVAQHYPLFRHRTVLGNLEVAGRQAGLSRGESRERAQRLLERFHLTDRATLYPTQLSGGQRQRVAIAQQLMCSSYFLLMDEPFSGLDPIQVETVIRLLFEVAGMHELQTIVVVTHDVSAAVLAADTIWLLGRDRDPANGDVIPGARIREVIDLVPRNLAWWQNPTYETPGFDETVHELRTKFSHM